MTRRDNTVYINMNGVMQEAAKAHVDIRAQLKTHVENHKQVREQKRREAQAQRGLRVSARER